MKKFRQMLLSLLLVLSFFPNDKILATSVEDNQKNIVDKIAKSSHPTLPEGVEVKKYVGDFYGDKQESFNYGESLTVPYVISITNQSGEELEKVFIQDDLSDLKEYITEETMDFDLHYSGRYLGDIYKEDGETPSDYTLKVRDLVEGMYFGLDSNVESYIEFQFEVELKSGFSEEELTILKNTVITNNLEYTHELPVIHADVIVDKQAVPYLGETPFEEIPNDDGSKDEGEEAGDDEEPIDEEYGDEEPPEDFSRFRLFNEEIAAEMEQLEYAEEGSKIRYAIVVENVGDARVHHYAISDVSLKELVPQYAQYVHREVSVYSGYNKIESFVLKEDLYLDDYKMIDKFDVEELEESYEINLNIGERKILVFDLILNDELPEDLEFIENVVEYHGKQVIERTPIKEKETEKPETPEEGEKPETPEEGEKPETPEEGEKPETPDEGEKPETPEEGEKPETPDEGEKPETPDEGEKPETPDEGEKPETPEEGTKPEIPQDNEKPTVQEPGNDKVDSNKTEAQLPATGRASLSNLSLRMMLIGFIMVLIAKDKN